MIAKCKNRGANTVLRIVFLSLKRLLSISILFLRSSHAFLVYFFRRRPITVRDRLNKRSRSNNIETGCHFEMAPIKMYFSNSLSHFLPLSFSLFLSLLLYYARTNSTCNLIPSLLFTRIMRDVVVGRAQITTDENKQSRVKDT